MEAVNILFINIDDIMSETEQLCLFDTEAEVRVTAGGIPPCGHSEEGQLWFNTLKRGLFLCDGITWLNMLQGDFVTAICMNVASIYNWHGI